MYLLEQWHSKYGLLKISISIHLRKKNWIFKKLFKFQKNLFHPKKSEKFPKKILTCFSGKGIAKEIVVLNKLNNCVSNKKFVSWSPALFSGILCTRVSKIGIWIRLARIPEISGALTFSNT